MLRARWLLCLTLFASAAGLAQVPSTPPPPLTPSSYEADSPRLPSAARIPLEILGGAAGGALSGLLVYSVGGILLGDCFDDPDCVFTHVGMTVGGIFLGTPLGVSVVGRLAGGRGSYWPALLGMAVGSGAGFAMAAAFKPHSEVLRYASLVTLPLSGAVVGYEISHAYSAASASPQIVPLVGVTPGGGLFGGLAARF